MFGKNVFNLTHRIFKVFLFVLSFWCVVTEVHQHIMLGPSCGSVWNKVVFIILYIFSICIYVTLLTILFYIYKKLYQYYTFYNLLIHFNIIYTLFTLTGIQMSVFTRSYAQTCSRMFAHYHNALF